MSVLGNLVHETTTTTGTGPLTIARTNGRQRIIELLNRYNLGVGDNGVRNPILFISNRDADEWAVVRGYLSDEDSPDGGTLVIDETLQSSNSDSAVTWSAGTKDITNAVPASYFDTINVKDFGAKGDGSTDDTAKCQAAIDAAKALGTAGGVTIGPLTTASLVWFPPGRYCVSNLDCTGFNGLTLAGNPGSVILYADKQATSSKPVFDFTGSSNCQVAGLIVAGQTPGGADPSIIPTIGYLLAETTTGGDSNKNRMDNCGSLGKFTVAPLVIYGSTDNAFYSCAFQQRTTDKPALFVSNTNSYSFSSPYKTIATAPSNTGDNTFYSCEFHGAASAAIATLQIYSVDNLRFYGGNCDNSSNAHSVLFNGSSKQVLFSGVKFYSENGSAPPDLFYADNAPCLRLGIVNCHTEDNAFSTNLVNGTGGVDFTGGYIEGVRAAALTGPYLHFFSSPLPTLGAGDVNLSAGATTYLTIGAANSTASNAHFPIGVSGTITGLRASTGGSPGSGQSYTFTLYKNGAATSMTCTISDGNTSASDLTNAVTVAPGDILSVQAVASASASNTGSVWAALGFIKG